MDDFPGLIARDFGFKPQSKGAPMAPPRNSPAGNFGGSFPSSNFGLGSDFVRSSSSARSKPPIFDDHDGAAAGDGLIFNDLFGGPSNHASFESRAPAPPTFDYDDVFGDHKISKSSSIPMYDKPVYDDDIFEGIPGLKSSSAASSAKYDDVFASISASPPKQKKQDGSPFDDLLGDLGRKDAEGKGMNRERDEKQDIRDLDDLIPGFGGSSSPPSKRSMPGLNKSQKSYRDSTGVASRGMEYSFVASESASNPTVFASGVYTDPLEEVGKHGNSRSRKTDQPPVPVGVFDDLDPLDDLGKFMPDISKRGKDTLPTRTESMNGTQSTVENLQSQRQRKDPDDFRGSHQSPFDLPSGSVGRSGSPPDMNASPNLANSRADTTSRSGFDSLDDVWLTVSEIPLSTQPTSAPPPSRPPPPRPTRPKRSESGSFSSRNPRKTYDGPSAFESSSRPCGPSSEYPSARSSVTSPIDELEDFATGRVRSEPNGYSEEFAGQDSEANSAAAAAAMKEAMDKAEANIRHAREMRERDYLKAFRSKETVQLDKDDYQEKEQREKQERLDGERQQRLREEEEKELRRLEKERARTRELEREQEERERERRRLEKERMERERELARQAVGRATREARERAAAEARAKAQKAAVEKAAAEARERAEKAAVQRAQAEARERAAMEARQKAEKAAAEARERANAEARERDAREARARAERAAVERAAAEARERAAAEARERAAAQARANQQKNDNDLESFFSSRASSAPRPRANASEPSFDTQNHRGPPGTARASTGASSSMRKTSSTTNIVDDLSSIFGEAAASPSGIFQDVDGETEERRRARLERHQRTQERAAKALAEKNERDLQTQREQAERHRVAESLDVEIRRWAAGKEGNLRAMLSTLQYVLWPECGWQPVSLTDLITAASVKKVYRKATLCIHPDKVQQKGATLQQKYVAEKVFDLLKEAWNKFNSEELF